MASRHVPPLKLRIKLQARESRQTPSNLSWRTKMNDMNPEKYEEVKERDKKYSKLRTATLTEEEMEHRRDLARERVRLYRLRKKEKEKAEKAAGKKPKKPDENEINMQRKKWTKCKREQRAKLQARESRKKKPSNLSWRTKMNNTNPKKYEEVKERDKKYSKLRAATLTEEEKEHRRDLARKRVRLYRLRKKVKEEADRAAGKKPKKPDENEIKMQRKKWTERKREERAKWSATKKEEVNLKLRMKREQDKLQKMQKQKYEDDEKERVGEDMEKRKEGEDKEKRKEGEGKEKRKEERNKEKTRKKKKQDEKQKEKRRAEEEDRTLRLQVEQLAKEQFSLETEAMNITTCISYKNSTLRSGSAKRESRARTEILPLPKEITDKVCELISQARPKKKKENSSVMYVFVV
ncbi:vicilin-like seed storage protein At2g18540 [Strongylocentrotus purpuratus]|uniref:Uncharacterized protein n=1 Tax=Strongylocentrotus purpuratus TaxID=7668 RepID=A0A7M7SYG0_STRPU|nr:vicilin-like seed storage protein At2g18540 [Strongylocentrotus purpuratus]